MKTRLRVISVVIFNCYNDAYSLGVTQNVFFFHPLPSSRDALSLRHRIFRLNHRSTMDSPKSVSSFNEWALKRKLLSSYRIVACYNSDVRRMSAEGAVMCSDTPTYGSLQLQGRQRKFSFPASFHSNILQSRTFQDINGNNNLQQFFLNRRRFSNVGDAVTRKLSTTIGWRNTQVIGKSSKIVIRRTIENSF